MIEARHIQKMLYEARSMKRRFDGSIPYMPKDEKNDETCNEFIQMLESALDTCVNNCADFRGFSKQAYEKPQFVSHWKETL